MTQKGAGVVRTRLYSDDRMGYRERILRAYVVKMLIGGERSSGELLQGDIAKFGAKSGELAAITADMVHAGLARRRDERHKNGTLQKLFSPTHLLLGDQRC